MTETLPLPELNRLAFNALFEKLGPAQAIRFLRQYSQGHGSYQAVKDRMFVGLSVDDIFDDALKHEAMRQREQANPSPACKVCEG